MSGIYSFGAELLSSRLLEYEVFPQMLGEDVLQGNAVLLAGVGGVGEIVKNYIPNV